MSIHMSKEARGNYQIDDALYSSNGTIHFVDFRAVRDFIQKVNQKKDLLRFPEQAAKASHINAIDIMDEIFRYVIQSYQEIYAASPEHNLDKGVMALALNWLKLKVGTDELTETLTVLVHAFPPKLVYKGLLTPNQYLNTDTSGIPNQEAMLIELILIWVANRNPALEQYREFFDEKDLVRNSEYGSVIESLQEFFRRQPGLGREQLNLIDFLRSPALAVPNSILGQMDFIRESWNSLLGGYLSRLLSSLDFLREEGKFRMVGPGETPVPTYDRKFTALEPEKFSKDTSWMTNLVLIAKNIYVWMDQLSKKYFREINRFDQIPEVELQSLSQSGITGLWLIGVWERSKASAKIKQLCGNPEALASAYSLLSYEIASDLGGEEAYNVFRDRAWKYGIRLGSDMVPNHMGIDSKWVIEHPDWFISVKQCPFPSYSFTGLDLSNDPNIQLRIEDHYYDRTDAAVVFQRVELSKGDVRYIYHGNDGTSMPWNDTAQLNYLNPDVREAVIQTILSVAKKFPIIRFDAAMTLTRQHFQRLWFPEPGTGGDIPSRAECGLSTEEFDQVMPFEFWREVVDRAAIETPDVLLLAEAFWLLEGYFVRTLGMHRVYNSAFMNMMRDEDNFKYRTVMKNTLAFEPEILRRFVNFMNNPDERTAVDQFGKDDKYFGVCTLMATLPGLPMIGHGQIEGYSEKYGMEYRKAYLGESVDTYLVERHQREIFPLLRKRYLFAEVQNFVLYDFRTVNGWVNEDVIAFSNRCGDESALIVFHNKYATTEGNVRMSVRFPVKTQNGERTYIQKTLVEGLNLEGGKKKFVIFRDHIRNLEYIRLVEKVQEDGIFLHLNAYEYHVFMNFRVVADDTQENYLQLYQYLGDLGVPSIDEAMQELYLEPVLHPFKELVNPGYFRYLLDIVHRRYEPDPASVLDELETKLLNLFRGIHGFTKLDIKEENEIIQYVLDEMKQVLGFNKTEPSTPSTNPGWRKKAIMMIERSSIDSDSVWFTIFFWIMISQLGKIVSSDAADKLDQRELCISRLEDWHFFSVYEKTLYDCGLSEVDVRECILGVRTMVSCQEWYNHLYEFSDLEILQNWLGNIDVQNYIGTNRFDGILWFNAESVKQFLWWMKFIAGLDVLVNDNYSRGKKMEIVLMVDEVIHLLSDCMRKSKYQVEKWLSLVGESENMPGTIQ